MRISWLHCQGQFLEQIAGVAPISAFVSREHECRVTYRHIRQSDSLLTLPSRGSDPLWAIVIPSQESEAREEYGVSCVLNASLNRLSAMTRLNLQERLALITRQHYYV
jgi:hypothetical protein